MVIIHYTYSRNSSRSYPYSRTGKLLPELLSVIKNNWGINMVYRNQGKLLPELLSIKKNSNFFRIFNKPFSIHFVVMLQLSVQTHQVNINVRLMRDC